MRHVFFLSALIASSTANAGKCESVRAFMEDGINSKDSVSARLLSSPGFKSASVLFVGEDHTDLITKKRTVEILKPFQAEPGTCLALELPNNLQKSIDRIPADGDSEEWAGKIAKQLVWDKTENSLEYATRQEVTQVAKEEMVSWVDLAKESKKQGNSVYAIDLDPRKRDKEIESDPDTQDRNQWISSDLNKRLKSGNCKKIISINGLFHLIKTRTDGSLKSLPTLMKEKGVTAHLLYDSNTPWVVDLGSPCNNLDLIEKLKDQRFVFNKTNADVSLFKILLPNSLEADFSYVPLYATGDTSIVFQYLFHPEAEKLNQSIRTRTLLQKIRHSANEGLLKFH